MILLKSTVVTTIYLLLAGLFIGGYARSLAVHYKIDVDKLLNGVKKIFRGSVYTLFVLEFIYLASGIINIMIK